MIQIITELIIRLLVAIPLGAVFVASLMKEEI